MNLVKKSAVVILSNKLNPKPVYRLGMKLIKEIENEK